MEVAQFLPISIEVLHPIYGIVRIAKCIFNETDCQMYSSLAGSIVEIIEVMKENIPRKLQISELYHLQIPFMYHNVNDQYLNDVILRKRQIYIRDCKLFIEHLFKENSI